MKCKFSYIEKKQLNEAIHEFLQKLDISGSIVGGYNLYSAIYKEWEKAKNLPE